MRENAKADLGSRGQTKDSSRERHLSGLYNRRNSLRIELIKLYSDQEKKFSGELYNILNLKLHIFYNCCQKVGIESN